MQDDIPFPGSPCADHGPFSEIPAVYSSDTAPMNSSPPAPVDQISSDLFMDQLITAPDQGIAGLVSQRIIDLLETGNIAINNSCRIGNRVTVPGGQRMTVHCPCELIVIAEIVQRAAADPSGAAEWK